MPRLMLSCRLGARSPAARGALKASVVVAAIGALGMLVAAYAQELGIRPGLWEIRLVRQVVDGREVSRQLTVSSVRAQPATLASLTPEERARVQSMLNDAAVNPGNKASFRLCISPQTAASDLPALEKNSSCRPVSASRTGNRTIFHIDCTVDGTHIQGQGDATSTGDVITTEDDITTRAPDGSMHSRHDETQMQYVGANCGSLAPAH